MTGLRSRIHTSQPIMHQRIWDLVSRSPLHSLWNLQGVTSRVVAQHTWSSLLSDNIFGRAAELGFYFLFALFPTLFCASSVLGIAAHSAADLYGRLLHYLSIVIPTAAMGISPRSSSILVWQPKECASSTRKECARVSMRT